MKNTKINYKWTANEDKSVPDNNYNAESMTVVCEQSWSWKDILENQCIPCEQVGNTTYVLDDNGERTGEAYMEIGRKDTDEAISE